MLIQPISSLYITMLLVTSTLMTFFPFLNIYWYFAFSIKQIVYNFQFWRLFTNFLIYPSIKLNIGLFFTMITFLTHLVEMEYKCRNNKQLSKFIMFLFIICSLNIIFNFIGKYFLNINENRTLVNQFLYSLYTISSWREPNKTINIFFMPVKNKYTPFAMIFMNIASGSAKEGKEFIEPGYGILSGFIYLFLNDMKDIVYIPKWLKKICKDRMNDYRNNSYYESDNNENKYKKNDKKDEVKINSNNNTNVAFREKGSVVEGNEFEDISQDKIKWE